MLDQWKKSRAVRKLEPGDGSALAPFRWWNLISGRKLFFLHLATGDGRVIHYAVDVRMSGKLAGDFGKAHLFRDGTHAAAGPLPAFLPVEGGTIEVAISEAGLKRMHFVGDDGRVQQLVAEPRSAIGRRLRFDRRHPVLGRWIGALSIVALIIGIGLNVLQLLEPISEFPPIVENFGRFESPIHLPLWINIGLGFAAAMGSWERALRLRHHWLLDGMGA